MLKLGVISKLFSAEHPGTPPKSVKVRPRAVPGSFFLSKPRKLSLKYTTRFFFKLRSALRQLSASGTRGSLNRFFFYRVPRGCRLTRMGSGVSRSAATCWFLPLGWPLVQFFGASELFVTNLFRVFFTLFGAALSCYRAAFFNFYFRRPVRSAR